MIIKICSFIGTFAALTFLYQNLFSKDHGKDEISSLEVSAIVVMFLSGIVGFIYSYDICQQAPIEDTPRHLTTVTSIERVSGNNGNQTHSSSSSNSNHMQSIV